MVRRAHVPVLREGEIQLPQAEAHHLRDVLRSKPGDMVELFDADGRTAEARVMFVSSSGVRVKVEGIREPQTSVSLTIASAVPKGERSDWMIEKLSELGVDRFVPLMTERSVVHPEGKNKFERWKRIASEAAKQSRRVGVMRIDSLASITSLLAAESAAAYYLSLEGQARSEEHTS